MSLKPSELLQKVYDLVSSPKSFNKGSFAADKDGRVVAVSSPYAKRWCIIGGLEKVAQETFDTGYSKHPSYHMAFDNIEFACKELHQTTPTYVNDMYGHQAVLTVLESAINKVIQLENALGKHIDASRVSHENEGAAA